MPCPARALALGQEQREHLDRLAEAHVVGQAGAEAEAGQERQPRQTRAPGRDAARRRTPAACGSAASRRSSPLEQIPKPATSRPARPWAPRAPGAVQTETLAQHLADRRAPLAAPAREETQRRVHVLGAEAHPATPRLDQRHLERGERLQLLDVSVSSPIAIRHSNAHRPVEAEQAAALSHSARVDRRLQLDPQAAGATSGGTSTANPACSSAGAASCRKRYGAGDVQLDMRRRCLAQRRLELGPKRQRMAEAAEQTLLRVARASARGQTAARCAPRPLRPRRARSGPPWTEAGSPHASSPAPPRTRVARAWMRQATHGRPARPGHSAPHGHPARRGVPARRGHPPPPPPRPAVPGESRCGTSVGRRSGQPAPTSRQSARRARPTPTDRLPPPGRLPAPPARPGWASSPGPPGRG